MADQQIQQVAAAAAAPTDLAQILAGIAQHQQATDERLLAMADFIAKLAATQQTAAERPPEPHPVAQQHIIQQGNAAAAAAVHHRSRPKTVFDGRKADQLDAWLFKMEQATAGLSDEVRIAEAVTLLDDAALQWRMTMQKPQYETWQQFCEAIRMRFGKFYSEDHARADLARLKQTTSVRDYTAQFERISAHIPNITAAEKLWWYKHGLKGQVFAVVASQAASYDHAVQVASSQDFIPGSSAYVAAKDYSATPQQMEVAQAEQNSPAANQEVNAARQLQQRHFNHGPGGECWNCKKRGHYAADCRQVCTRCMDNRDRHSRAACPAAQSARPSQSRQQARGYNRIGNVEKATAQ